MTERLVILGGPGDGFVIAEAIRQAAASGQDVSLVGFLNDALPRGHVLQGVPVLGRLEDWRELAEDILFVPAVQKVREAPRRVHRVEQLLIPDERWGSIRHPLSVVASGVEIGGGSFVGSFVTVQPDAKIGRFVSIRAGASIGHHAVVQDHAYVGPNATLCGKAELRRGGHLGPNAVVLDGKIIGAFAVVGIGGAVTKNIEDYAVVTGNPARRVGVVSREFTTAPPANSS
jgi:sugar O-acyltransferase (sialic acid O-acetyltransferase NeuD family)